jgi:hypothetical protein
MSMMGWADRTINALTKCNVHESVIALNRPASYQVQITSMVREGEPQGRRGIVLPVLRGKGDELLQLLLLNCQPVGICLLIIKWTYLETCGRGGKSQIGADEAPGGGASCVAKTQNAGEIFLTSGGRCHPITSLLSASPIISALQVRTLERKCLA